jgi:hypothetical protein
MRGEIMPTNDETAQETGDWKKKIFDVLVRVYIVRLIFLLGNRRRRLGIGTEKEQWYHTARAFSHLLGAQFEEALKALLGENLPEPFQTLLEDVSESEGEEEVS